MSDVGVHFNADDGTNVTKRQNHLQTIITNGTAKEALADWVYMIPIWVAFRVSTFINTFGEDVVSYFQLARHHTPYCNVIDIDGFTSFDRAAKVIGTWIFPELGTHYDEKTYPQHVAFVRWITNIAETFLRNHFKLSHVKYNGTNIYYLYYARTPTSVPSLGGAAHTFVLPAITARIFLALDNCKSIIDCNKEEDLAIDECDDYNIRQLAASTFSTVSPQINAQLVDDSLAFVRDIHASWIPGKGLDVVVYDSSDATTTITEVTFHERDGGAVPFVSMHILESILAIQYVDQMRYGLCGTASKTSIIFSACTAKELAVVDVVPRLLLLHAWNDPIDAVRMVLEIAPAIYTIYADASPHARKAPPPDTLLKWLNETETVSDNGINVTMVNKMLTVLDTMATDFAYKCGMFNEFDLHPNLPTSSKVVQHFSFQNCDAPPTHAWYNNLRTGHILRSRLNGTDPLQSYHFFPSCRLSAIDSIALKIGVSLYKDQFATITAASKRGDPENKLSV